MQSVRRALVSVADKAGIVEFVDGLKEFGVEIKSKEDFMSFSRKHKHKNIRGVYTNKNRVEALTKMGADPVPGLIKTPAVVGEKNVVYLPDWKERKKRFAPTGSLYNPLILNSLVFFLSKTSFNRYSTYGSELSLSMHETIYI